MGSFFFLFFFTLAQAQVADNFSDGNFTIDPVWSGSTGQFMVNTSGQLQLNGSMAGSSYLSTPLAASSIENFEWQVYVKQSFSPSGSNYGRVYLVSDQEDLSLALNGYYLQFGEAGSNDAVELFQQTGLESTSICRAVNGAIASSFTVRIKVQRAEGGLWKLFADYSGGANFVLEATGTDEKHPNSSFFGLFCSYTASNASKFYYDDFLAGPQQDDLIPPFIESVEVLSINQLSLHFSEALDGRSAMSVFNYSATNNLGSPLSAGLKGDDRIVDLLFAGNFSNGVQNQISVSGVTDLSGNSMTAVQLPFMFFQSVPVSPKDVILTEVFADPVPQVGLPGGEFVEILNRSKNPIDLGGWRLGDGTSAITLPAQIILSGQYCIVTGAAYAQAYAAFGTVTSVPVFLTLNNEADTLTLKSPGGLTIDSLNYSTAWYHEDGKQEGGWSLELIDPDNPCGEEENWTASEDPLGGTPGKENSVFASKPDRTGPMLLSVIPAEPSHIRLRFNEKLDDAIPSASSFKLNPSVSIFSVNFTDRSHREVQLNLGNPLEFGQLYTVKIQDVWDCNKNLIQDEFSQLDFALPEPSDSSDVLINEILFNPRPNGVDFVEVYNRSAKYIDLKNWRLANFEGKTIANPEEITAINPMLAPDSYRVFTSDPALLKNNYPQSREDNFIAMKTPALPDDEGSIAIVSDRGRVIDCFFYAKDFHSALIRDDEGVSLERISISNPTNDPQNWKSASSQAGFATPGYINSNAHPEHPVSLGNILIEPEIFVPGSGGQDFTKINYAFDQAGYIANIRILDQQGHLIKVIANNETLGFTGFFRWDGDRDDGSKTRMGYYAVWVEVFDLSGSVKTFRKRVVVATR